MKKNLSEIGLQDLVTSEENDIINRLREKAFQRINSSSKGSIVVDRNWIIDDSELSYIEIPKREPLS